jgi:hypothetical protein
MNRTLPMLAVIALIASGLILSDHQHSASGSNNAGKNNGLDCSTISTFSAEHDHGEHYPPRSDTLEIEFLPGNKARFRIDDTGQFDLTVPMTTTGALYTFFMNKDDPDRTVTIDRKTGSYYLDTLASAPGEGWNRTLTIGKCHPVRIEPKM